MEDREIEISYKQVGVGFLVYTNRCVATSDAKERGINFPIVWKRRVANRTERRFEDGDADKRRYQLL